METNLAKRIRIILEEQHLKQIELAEDLGVSTNYISLLANGRKDKVSLTLAKLVEALYGYTSEWVMTGNGIKSRTEQLRQRAVDMIMNMDTTELIKLKDFIR